MRPLGGLLKTLNNVLHILSIESDSVFLLITIKSVPTLKLKASLTEIETPPPLPRLIY